MKPSYTKKRIAAVIICLALVLSSTALSVNRSLGKECRRITDTFYAGVYNAEWKTTRPSIDAQLKKRYEAANGLITVSAGIETLKLETEALRKANQSLLAADGIAEKYAENMHLIAAYYGCLNKLDSLELSERMRLILETSAEDFQIAQGLIESAGYNETVKSFYRATLDKFPASFLRAFVQEDLPELFA
jgi:hypothetical protein